MRSIRTSLLIVCAGSMASVGTAGEDIQVVQPTAVRGAETAHIYMNLATGERVVTLAPSPRDVEAPRAADESEPVWLSLTPFNCGDGGGTTQGLGFFLLFGEDGTEQVRDWGDLPLDTLVDCVHISWATTFVDEDPHGDGVGDGVSGLGGQWAFNDADDGHEIDHSTRLPIISFTFQDLPGSILGPGAVMRYSADIDLVSTFTGTDLSFEIGDSDGDCQGAGFCNNDVDTDGDGIGDGVSVANADRNNDGLPDGDLDGDGLFDWSYDISLFRPGSTDFDGDGEPDGTPDPDAFLGVQIASPAGMAVTDGMGNWGWDLDLTSPGAGTGSEDLFMVDGVRTNFGGFSCEPGMLVPRADIAMGLYATPDFGPCPADYNGDGNFDFFDMSEFFKDFKNMTPGTDLNSDGEHNFFDVAEYMRWIQDPACR